LFLCEYWVAAITDFRVCPPLVKCQNVLFSGFIDTLMYVFSSTGVTIYSYFGLKFNDNTCCEVICKRRYNDNDITHPTTGYLDSRCYPELRSYLRHTEWQVGISLAFFFHFIYFQNILTTGMKLRIIFLLHNTSSSRCTGR
jgi:hypothetical protein